MSKFRVLGEIAHGGFGQVERVEMPDGTIVARKVFAPSPTVTSGADMDKLRKRFTREARMQSALGGDYVIPVLERDLDAPEPWYTMPLAVRNYQSQILDERASGTFTHEPLADILNALEVTHQLGYAHRDLKPANVLLHDGKWKLSDFGLALPPTGATTRITSADSSWGTLAYCAPEQAMAFGKAGPAADIFAFGCILHDIFGSTHPRTPLGRASADGPIGRIIEKCTEQMVPKRFRSVAALRAALLSVLASRVPIDQTPEEQQWLADLPTAATWTVEKIEEFARHLEQLHPSGENEPIFAALDEGILGALVSKDPIVGESIAEPYCDWVKSTGFTFSYCDVIVHRVQAVLQHGSLTSKAHAALAAAELGSSHNRWFVMNVHLSACGPGLADAAAQRIALEVEIEGAHMNFIRCAQVIQRAISAYHPAIASVLQRYIDNGGQC